jgi:hypothetical protein
MENMNTKGNDSGFKYRWPMNTDQLWAKEGDIVCIVLEPVTIGSNKRVFQMSAQEVNRFKEKIAKIK